jgi:hypothetical protein
VPTTDAMAEQEAPDSHWNSAWDSDVAAAPLILIRYISPQTVRAPLFVLTWNAGPNGYARLLRWWGEGRDGGQELKEL